MVDQSSVWWNRVRARITKTTTKAVRAFFAQDKDRCLAFRQDLSAEEGQEGSGKIQRSVVWRSARKVWKCRLPRPMATVSAARKPRKLGAMEEASVRFPVNS